MYRNHANLPRYPSRRVSLRDDSSPPSFAPPSLPSTSVSPTSSPRRPIPPAETFYCQHHSSGPEDLEKGHHSLGSTPPASPCPRQIDRESQDFGVVHRIWCKGLRVFRQLCMRYPHYHEEYRIERKLCNLKNKRNRYIKMIHKDTRYVGRWLRRFLMMFLWTVIATTFIINHWFFNTSAVETNSEKAPVRRSSLDDSAAGFEGVYGRSTRPLWKHQSSHAGTIFSRLRPFFFEICIVGSAFSMAQGLMTLRGARIVMERIGHTTTTIATSMLKSTQAINSERLIMKDKAEYEKQQKLLQHRIFKCLVLLTAYPVFLLREEESGGLSIDVEKRCNEAARRLKKLCPIQQCKFQAQTQLQNGASVPESSVNEKSNAGHDHFFEAFSLELEMECRNKCRISCSRDKLPPQATPQIITRIRMILENLIDGYQLDLSRSPIVRENIDVMALSARESLIYSHDDAIPVGFLNLFGIIARGMCFAIPFILDFDWDSLSMPHRILPWLFVAFVSAAGLTILDETSRLWKTFRRMNTYAWTLGIAQEIDKLLQDQNGREEVDMRKHGYMIEYEEALGKATSALHGMR